MHCWKGCRRSERMDSMGRKRAVIPLILSVFMLVFVLSACANDKDDASQNRQSPQQEDKEDAVIPTLKDMVGIPDSKLVEIKGEGTVELNDNVARQIIAAREYEGTMFGLDATLTFLLSDDGRVCRITGEFGAAEAEQVVETIEAVLGQPADIEKDEAIDYTAIWNKDGITYTLFADAGMPLSCQMERTIE